MISPSRSSILCMDSGRRRNSASETRDLAATDTFSIVAGFGPVATDLGRRLARSRRSLDQLLRSPKKAPTTSEGA